MATVSLDQLSTKKSVSLEELSAPPAVESKGLDFSAFNNFFKQAKQAEQADEQTQNEAANTTLKTLAKGAVSLGELSLQGVSGLGAVTQRSYSNSQEMLDRFEYGRKLMEDWQKEHPVTLFDESNQELRNMGMAGVEEKRAKEHPAEAVMAALPETIQKFSDWVFEKTEGLDPELRGFLGAATMGGLTYLTLKPDTVLGPVKELKDLAFSKKEPTKITEPVQAAFDDLAVKQPEAAANFADSVAQVEPKTGEKLKAKLRMNQETGQWEPVGNPEVIGTKAAEKDVAAAPKVESGEPAPWSKEWMAARGMWEFKGKVYERGPNGQAVEVRVSPDVTFPEEPKASFLPGNNDITPQLLPDTILKSEKPIRGDFQTALQEAVQKGKIAPEEAELAAWFGSRGNNLVKNITLEVASESGGKTAAQYFPSGRRNAMGSLQYLIRAFKDKKPVYGETLVHEVLHHMERMLPENLHRQVRAMWARDLADMAKNGTELQKETVSHIHEFHRTGKTTWLDDAHESATLYALENGDRVSSRAAHQRYQQMYQYWDPSEYWAVNGARIMSDLYKGLKSDSKGAFRRWGLATLDKIKNLLGVDKDTALMAAIRDVFKGNGEFKTARMLSARMDQIIRETPELTAQAAADLVSKGADEMYGTLRLRPEAVKNSQKLVEDAFKMSLDAANKVPGVRAVTAKMKVYFDEALRTVNPGALGKKAKTAESILASNFARQAHEDSVVYHNSLVRGAFWDRNMAAARQFIQWFERGAKFKDASMEAMAQGYRDWNKMIHDSDTKAGISYDAVDNYLYHVFEDGPKVEQYLTAKYGNKWGKPGFMKDRGYDLYEEAIKGGYKPRFTNPEDIMLARQHASSIAQMRVNILQEMADAGLAFNKKLVEEPPSPSYANTRTSPNGNSYWVHDQAEALFRNAFDTKSLWSMPGIRGDLFRGAMNLKNAIVPFQLALSLFHPLHVATIDNATAMVRASKSLLAGTSSPTAWLKDMAKAGAYTELLGETAGQLGTLVGGKPRGGYRLLNVWKGLVPDAELTAADRVALQYMTDGGLIPEMSSQYRTHAIDNFKKSIRQGSLMKGAFQLPFAAMEALQAPMFQVWIPSLKIASYLRDVQTAIKADSSLVMNTVKRREVFMQLRKSVDNRYGEMAYNTLFWNKMVKDLAVANTLSLGWQMGFLREYGGAVTDLLKVEKGASAAGKLDRPMFVTFYTTQALLYGGLITYMMTGKQPESLEDYVIPRTGKVDENEKPERLNTMFYSREFLAIGKHMQNEGMFSGLSHLVQNKASGVIGFTGMALTGVNSMDQEIRDPKAPIFQQMVQTLNGLFGELTPISVEAMKEGQSPGLSLMGFNKAPAYMTETPIEGKIKSTYVKYFGSKLTPYERAEMSTEVRELRRLYADDPKNEYDNKLDALQEKFDLSAQDLRRLQKGFGDGVPATFKMFQRLTWQQQQNLLDQMTEDEREAYLPYANRQHLRRSYEASEDRK